MQELSKCKGFEWDKGNSEKGWTSHQVTRAECEQVFFNQPFVAAGDESRSQEEPRYYALGQTDVGRRLFIAFTIRGERIRVISARDMSRRERRMYDDANKETNTEV
jgi:hypothetical protein